MRWTSSRRSCGILLCALFGRGEGVAAPPPPWPPAPPLAGGASRLFSLPSVQSKTSARTNEQDPKKGGWDSDLISGKNGSIMHIHTNLKSISDSPYPLWGLISVFLSACLWMEHHWPASAAQMATKPAEEPAPESEASPTQNSQENPPLISPDSWFQHWQCATLCKRSKI